MRPSLEGRVHFHPIILALLRVQLAYSSRLKVKKLKAGRSILCWYSFEFKISRLQAMKEFRHKNQN